MKRQNYTTPLSDAYQTNLFSPAGRDEHHGAVYKLSALTRSRKPPKWS